MLTVVLGFASHLMSSPMFDIRVMSMLWHSLSKTNPCGCCVFIAEQTEEFQSALGGPENEPTKDDSDDECVRRSVRQEEEWESQHLDLRISSASCCSSCCVSRLKVGSLFSGNCVGGAPVSEQ
eukprot:2667468-Rhodomonas_salina.1